MAEAAGEDAIRRNSRLFDGLSVFILQRVPSRSAWKEHIESNGGKVVPLEAQARYIIADHARKDSPNGSLSWKWIEDSVKEGRLLETASYTLHTASGANRPAGTTTIAPRKTRNEYTAQEDLELRKYVQYCTQGYVDGRGQSGNTIYRDYESVFPQHTWQSWRDHYVKVLKHLGPLDISDYELPPELEMIRADTSFPAGPATESQPTIETSEGARVRTLFTPEEDHGLYDYVCSQPLNKRHGDRIYQAYAEQNPRHTWQSWRSRFVKFLESNPPVASPISNAANSSKKRQMFTPEDDWEVWNYVMRRVQDDRNYASGASVIYQDFAEINDKHPWQSWRAHYLRYLRFNPPTAPSKANQAPGTQATNEASGRDRRISESGQQMQFGQVAIDERQRSHRSANNTHEAQHTRAALANDLNQSSRNAANAAPTTRIHDHIAPRQDQSATQLDSAEQGQPTSRTSPSSSKSKETISNPSDIEDPILSASQQAIVAAVLDRKPRDSKGVYYTALEISHLVLNMPDPTSKTLSDEHLEMWEEWTKVMGSRIPQDWKDLYNDHVYHEAVRLGSTPTEPSPARSEIPVTSKKRRASTPIEAETNKRPRTGGLITDSSSEPPTPRPQQERPHGSTPRTPSEQSTRKRQTERSIQQSPSEIIVANKLTAASLVAQATAQAATQATGQATVQVATQATAQQAFSTRPASRDRTETSGPHKSDSMSAREDRIRVSHNSGDGQSSNLFCTPAPDDVAARPTQAATQVPNPNNEILQEQPGEADPNKSKTDTSLNLYESSIPLREHTGPFQHEDTTSEQDSPRASQEYFTAPLPGTQSESTDSQEEYLRMLSPPGSHPSVPADFDEAQVPGEHSSIESLPDTHLAQIVQRIINDHVPASPHGSRRREPGSSPAFESLDSDEDHTARLSTQGILDAETQMPDLSLPLPSESFRSSPPPAPSSPPDAASVSEEASGHSTEEVLDMMEPYFKRFTDNQVIEALHAASARPTLAIAILDHYPQTFQPDANWRWSKEEDEILQGINAKSLKLLEDKHGSHEYDARMQFLREWTGGHE